MYNGKEKLRGAGEEIEYTPEMIQEWIKCKTDIIYFAEKYFYIVSIDDGKHKISLFDFQKKTLKLFMGDDDNIVLMPRQMGKSTTASVYLLHYMLFQEDSDVAIMANKESAAKGVLRRVKGAYEMLPLWLQQGVVEWNKTSIELENGNKMTASSTSPDSISGDSISLLYMDEFAKVPAHIADEFITATLPVVSSGDSSKVILVSTPKGLNHFYDYWKGAMDDKNGFIPIKVSWWEHPKRDKAWKERTLKKLNNDVDKFNQEYGCRFLGSNSPLVDADILEQTSYVDPIGIKWDGSLKIYEYPVAGDLYILGVDTAKGTNRDYSVVQVFKIINENSLEQVAVYRNNKVSPHDFAQVCIGISKFYNKGYMMIENNGIGDSLATTIWYEYEYDSIINLDNKGLGVTSTTKSKLQANLLFKRYFDNEMIKIVDKDTIFELARYVEVRTNIYRCESTQGHDDTVTACLWALYFIVTDFFDGKALEVKTLDDQYDLGDDGPIMFLPT